MKKDILQKLKEAQTSKSITLNDIQVTDEIWNKIVKLTQLEYLYIYKSDIGNVPDNISNLSKLERLTLNECNLSGLPLNLANLVSLNYFSLSKNSFTKVPKLLSKFSLLRVLDLSDNKILDYSGLKQLTKLNTLYLNRNKLTNIPNEVKFLKDLEHIGLSDKIKTIPKFMSNLEKLIYFDIQNSELVAIPSGISFMKNLEIIEMSGNQISFISDEVLKLKKIKRLRFYDNKIRKIPSKISILKNLESLDLSSNKIENIPHEISKLQNIRNIDLEGNPINALKFGYIISDEKHDFRHRFHKMRYRKEKEIFNFQELDYEINYGESFIFLKTKNSHAFIELIDHPGKLEMRREFRKRDFYKSFRHGAGFVIYVFGETETQKKILSDIRNHLDKWIKKENIEFDANRKGYRKEKFAFRFFYYPIRKKYEREIVIDYDKLLKYKEANQYAYFDDDWGEKFPVSDLLAYINIDDIHLDKKWKGTNYLSQIKIKNLKLFDNIEFKLNSKINILLGHNGLGKTSILQGITMGLLPTENIDKSDNFIEYIKFENERTEIYINYGENEQRVVHVIPSGLSEMKHIENPSHILLSYGVNLNADTKIDTKFYEQIVKGNAKLYSTKSIFKDYSNDFNDPLTILYELQKESKHNPKLKNIIKLIVDKINDYLNLISENEKIQLIEENDFFAFKDLNNNKLKLQNLSEGYKDHILLISDILFRIISARNILFKSKTIDKNIFKKVKGIILIDEFDRHLHPVWQRRLLIRLKKDFSNIQFILTTHNVFSLQSAVGATAHQILIKESGIHVESSKIKAENILSIIREFYTKDFFDYETQNELNLLSEYLDKIHDGKIDLVYSENFRETVEKLNNMGEEIQSIIASQLLQLNSALKKIGKKEFVL